MRIFLLAIFILLVVFMTGCDDNDSTTTAAPIEPAIDIVILMDSVAVDTLHITEENHGDSISVTSGDEVLGELVCSVISYFPESSDQQQAYFRILARKNGCYTQFYSSEQYSTLEIDYETSFEIYDPETVCGIVIMGSASQNRFSGLFKDHDISIYSETDSVTVDSIYTDTDGRFVTDLAPGDYIAYINPDLDDPFTTLIDTPFHLSRGFNELYFPLDSAIWAKPNIYLYPTEAITLDVNLEFPQGGNVTISDPKYPEQWQNIRVEPDGTIDGKHRYLFYEAETPPVAQHSAGWVVAREDLEDFFTGNLRETGFIQSEIDDFIEWWIPRLTHSEYYAIYPQYNAQIDPVITLNISEPPNNVIRLVYYVDSIESPDLELQTPTIPDFERTGFVVAEWGLIPSGDTQIRLASKTSF